MLRTSGSRTVRRFLSTAPRMMAEGDTGSPRAVGDSFTKREKASEDLYFRKKEREKLTELHEKLQKQKQYITELQQHIEDLQKEGGGEQH